MEDRKILNPEDISIEKVAAPMPAADFVTADPDPTDSPFVHGGDDWADDIY